MAVFLLECRKDEERLANFPSKEASSPVLEMIASFTDAAILANSVVTNNIIIVFL